ncbi:Na/Pi cotransporter family protein [Agrobacterium cavarae]|uniref:Na/Pi cotransporter family protein n=1 Tax=Agrobacterium cavarae TaxID=2528239 RepID=A0ABY1Y441_9HYPH|nr:Na/Pi cotransporter family protein [Agrobacterium cavarae]KQM33649.1 sodium:phosphate symporter [Rhizobium sp. Leaf202]KQN85609.1 sodium:phosphate symporter [Rhizobium sp. Leaf68]KQR33681.1 sodium:phosphate symporter [Rhizobium sp. Leaf155]MQB21588.1 Na/Pi cotransporter family protein [Agrobacterium tumefaciens]TBN09322.1 Na/Pi cotransporter family protein [Agrobacterium cavarae]
MESTIVIVNLLGAVALLLFGLTQVKDGVTRAFGLKLRTILATSTRNGPRSFVSGFFATIALQSSTATALTVASFAERDLIRPRMAQIVLLGANVGTAVTAWIFATGVAWLSPLLILSGIVLRKGNSNARQGGGTALVGVGLMLLSLHLLSNATEPMRASPALGAFIGLLDDAWPVALLLSAAMAFFSSSSLAMVVLILSLASAGILSTGLIIVLVLGANLGGAIPPVIATMSGPAAARRITLGNLVIRAIGCAIAMPLASYGAIALQQLPLSESMLPVDAHLIFNILLTIVAWPLSGFVSDLMAKVVPSDVQSDDGPRFLDKDALDTPVVALANATREVLVIGDTIERMLIRAENAFKHNDLAPLAEIAMLEKKVDQLQQEVKIYLSQLGRKGLDENDARRSITVIDYAINLEHMGDIIEKGLCEQIRKKILNGFKFSDEGYDELKTLFDMTIENLRAAQSIFVTGDLSLARRLMEIKIDIRRLEKRSSGRHLERLRDGLMESLQTSSLHLDMLRDLKRINAHIVSVAHPILDESGILGESRLRTAETRA